MLYFVVDRRPAAQRWSEPVARALAGRRWFPLWAVVHHHGRKTGTHFATPIAVVPTVDRTAILVCLPWGAQTNWALNVVAADGASLKWRGRKLRVVEPRIIDCEEARAMSRRPFGVVVARMPAAIVLTRTSPPHHEDDRPLPTAGD
jgi:deazaflavin-dependent oxidoreductase (nitroreductase family)